MVRLASRIVWTALVAALAVPVSGRGVSPAIAAKAGTIDVVDCAFLAEAGEQPDLGAAWCGELTVPEDWSAPAGRELTIRFIVLEASGADPMPDPVLFLNGGPGSSSLASARTYAALLEPFRRQRDIVLFDQRGTAFSSPLRCADWTIDQVLGVSLASLGDDQPPLPQATPRPPSEVNADALLEEARDQLAGRYRECARQMADQGVDLTQYNSIANANDAVALVTGLGYDRFNLYGISYGARLALVTAREHPGSGIRSMVLDSVYPPQVNGFEQYPAELPEVVRQLLADCAWDRDCARDYPELGRRLAALLDRLDREPAPLPGGGSVTSAMVVELLSRLGSFVEIAPWTPRLIAELERGETGVWQGLASGALLGMPGEPAPSPAPQATATAPDDADLDELRVSLLELLPPPEALADPAAASVLDALVRAARDAPPEDGANLALRLVFAGKLPPNRASLAAFIDGAVPASMPADARTALASAAAAMPDAAIADLFLALRDATDAIDPYAYSLNPFLYSAVECNEEIPFERLDRAVELAREAAIPQLAAPGLEMAAAQFAICEEWPSGRAPEREREPVDTDVPALILAGSYDLETPVSWNRQAFVSLPNATYVQFPMSGHGVLQYSACAERIARAFIDDPWQPPNTACVSGLRPRFIGPDAPLPGAPGAVMTPATSSDENPFMLPEPTPAK